VSGFIPRMFFRVSRAVILVALPIIGGCEFDPSERVHSPTQPNCVSQDGVVWVAVKLAGDNDEWSYVPEQAAVASRAIDAPDGYSFSVLVNGKAWRVTNHKDIGYANAGFQDADISANPNLVLVTVLLGVTTVILLLATAVGWIKVFEHEDSIEGAEAEIKLLKHLRREREREITQEREVFAEQCRDAEKKLIDECKKLKAEWEKIDANRDELEKQKRVMVAAGKERQTVKHEPASDEDRRKFGSVVRDRLLGGKETNREISVEYAFDPEMTGALLFRWQLVQDWPYPPALTVLRDEAVIRTASAVFNGEFAYFLIKTGKRYKFTFSLHNGDRHLPNPLVVELTIPPLEAWNRRSIPKPPPKKMSREEREHVAMAWEAREKQRASESEKDPAKLKEMFAKIEQERMEKFGEAE
jgi:hypothetical protein